jgi:hypothetical protein
LSISAASLNNQLKKKKKKKGITVLLAGFLLGLTFEAVCSSKTSVAFHRTTRRYIPEKISLQIHVPPILLAKSDYFRSLTAFNL